MFWPPSIPKSHPGQQNENSIQLFYIFYLWEVENTYIVMYKNLWNLLCNWPLMIFDPFDLTPRSPVWPLALGWNIYLHSVLLITPIHLISHMTMLKKKNWPLGTHLRPQVPPLGHDPGIRTIILFDLFYIFFVRTHTKLGIKILKIYPVTEI